MLASHPLGCVPSIRMCPIYIRNNLMPKTTHFSREPPKPFPSESNISHRSLPKAQTSQLLWSTNNLSYDKMIFLPFPRPRPKKIPNDGCILLFCFSMNFLQYIEIEGKRVKLIRNIFTMCMSVFLFEVFLTKIFSVKLFLE